MLDNKEIPSDEVKEEGWGPLAGMTANETGGINSITPPVTFSPKGSSIKKKRKVSEKMLAHLARCRAKKAEKLGGVSDNNAIKNSTDAKVNNEYDEKLKCDSLEEGVKKHGVDTFVGEIKVAEKSYSEKSLKKPKQVGGSKEIGVGGGFRDPGITEKAEEANPIIKKAGKGEPFKLDFALSAKQAEALNHPAKFLLYGGAKGGGKSWFLCIWVFLMAMRYRGNKIFFCRRRSVDFTNTTLETWRKSIPANLYRLNEQKKKIYILASGSVVDYGGLDDPLLIQSLNSAEYCHVGIDQAEEIEKDSFSMIRGTLRHRLPDGSCPPYQIRLTANPAQCWLKDDFILRPGKDMAYLPALPTDNPKLPKDYVENLTEAFRHRPHLLAAYLHGSWDDLSGNDMCIRGKWIEEAKSKVLPDGAVLRRIVVNDPAISGDENVVFLMEQRGGVFYKADELVIEHKRPLETASLLAAYRRRTKAQIVAVDCIGIGTGVVDGLVALDEPVLSINSSSKPTNAVKNIRYVNLRAQMWWEASDKFANGKVQVPSDDFELASQLGSVKFEPSLNGKVQVESKDEIKKRIGRSPDRADAFVMGLYALDYVDRLDAEEYAEKSSDRQGHGEIVEDRNEEYVGCGEDYSGYNF